MRFSLLPKGNFFYELLIKLSLKGQQTVKFFKKSVEAGGISPQDLQTIRALEHEADEIVHEIMVKLNKSFITPIDREDIQQLTKKIDDLIDMVHTLAERISLFQISRIRNYLKETVDVLDKGCDSMVLAVQNIQSLSDPKALFELCINIHTFENQGDRLFERSLGELFQQEKDPIEIIKWKEIYDFLELAIDKCEDIADIIWGIVVKYG